VLLRESTYCPRGFAHGLSRVQSAEDVGVSPTTFDRMIKDRLLPQPVRIYGRTVWDVRKLDAAFAELDKDPIADDPWRKMTL
jgi:predicted DNA-binding transcriptional regulator AlpA